MGARLPLAIAILAIGVALGFAIANETPIGAIKGRVVAQESGAPIPAAVELISDTAPADDHGRAMRFSQTAAVDGTFAFTRVPAGDYTLHINGAVHHMKPTSVTIEEAQTQTIEAELTPDRPSLDLYVHQHIFTPDEKPQVTCHGFVTDADYVDFLLYKVKPDLFLKAAGGSLRDLLTGQGGSDKVDLERNSAVTRVAAYTERITQRDQEGVFTQRFEFAILPPGLYVTQARAGSVRSLDWIMVTKIGLISKTVGPNVLAYAVDLKTGNPVADAVVELFSDGQRLGAGRTDSDGMASFTASSEGDEGDSDIIARSGDSFALVSTWMESSDSSGDIIYTYTDRPVYRPGQKVFFKGIARSHKNDGYETLAERPVRVEVRDSRDSPVYHGILRTDQFGSYFGSLDLNEEASTGYYTITTTMAGAPGGKEAGFRVMSYRKPEFSVKVTFPKKRYLLGETVRAKISAQYYFGAPVADAKVSYYVSRSPYWLLGDEEEYGDYEDYGGYGESVVEGDVRTDANGEAEIEFGADWPEPDEEDPYDTDQMFSIDAYVTDQSDQSADGAGTVIATRGEFTMDVSSGSYVVEPGKNVTSEISVRDYDNKPVVNQRIKVTVGRQFWRENEFEFKPFKSFSVKTDRSGMASVTFKARRGDIRINAVAKDRRGNTIVGSDYVWCWDGAYGDMEGVRYSDLQIVLDKKTYNPGDTAKVLINTARSGATALVTVEADRVYYSKTLPIKGATTMVEIPIKAEYRPNFYVGVCFVRNKKFYEQTARAKVTLTNDELKIDVRPNKPKYKPGEEAVYQLTATDAAGKPAVAQLSVGVVDEAIYAIARDDTTPILEHFYSRKPNSVRTNFSFPQIYLSDPDKAGSPKLRTDQRNVRIRKRFLDTAFWSPDVVTDARGRATVRFHMPDNLTTWRATVRGITAGTVCGQTTDKVLAQQDMLVRLEAPRFLVQTDQATITAAVHNYTGRAQSVRVSLKAPGLVIDGDASREVRVGNGKVARLDWQVSAPKPGNFDLTVTARGETAGDAMQVSLPVHPHGEQRQWLKVGNLTDNNAMSETVLVRSDAIPEATKLRIRLAPSLASTLLGSLDYLAAYPYGCTEQTTSSFLPDVVLNQSFRQIGAINPELSKKLPDMVMKGLYRLYRFQLEDGGWSWCEYGKADPWMTAYVCYGLIRARDAGFTVNPQVLKNGIERLAKLAPPLSPTKPLDDQGAYIYYVLTLAGWDSSQTFKQALSRNTLDSSGLAYAVLSLVRTGHVDDARAGMARLYDNATREPGILFWSDGGDWRGDYVETTAVALEAALAVDPDDSRIPEIVRWLMRVREGTYWYSTRQTAGVLFAMAEYLKHTDELAPDYTAVVRVNGQQVGSFRFGKSSVFDLDKVVRVPAGLMRKGRNSVDVTKSGTGNLYYSIELTQYLAKKTMPALVTGSGLSVTRTYYASGRVGRPGQAPGRQISQANAGDVILVRLVVNASKAHRYMLLEDYVPAGCEIIDKGEVDYWEWDYWYVGRDIRDDHIAFFLDNMSKGKSVVEYRMRAGFPGAYHALPSQLYNMYQPDVRAATAETEFVVR